MYYKIRDSVLMLVVVSTVLWCAYLLGMRIFYLLDHDTYHGDAAFYFTVGRSIVNGLIPYADIFDPKPPGVFILSALSLLLFGNHMLGNILSVPLLLAVPILLVRLLWQPTFSLPIVDRFTVRGAGFIAGSVLALWSSIQAGVWQPESFGNFFGFLYILLFLSWRNSMTKWRTLAAALCLFFAIGFKEPFLLTLFAAALVIDQRIKVLWRAFGIPLFLALALGAVVLLGFGWFDAYVRLYLPTVVGIRIGDEVPLWMRGMYFWKMSSALSYTSFFLFPFVLLLTAWRAVDICLKKERVLPSLFGLIAGAYVSVTAVGLAGNYTMLSYSASLVPFVTALMLLLLLQMCDAGRLYPRRLMALGTLLVVFLAWTIPTMRVYPAELESQAEIQSLKEAAGRLDALLRACAIDRYLYAVNPPQPLLPAYTEISPLNHFPYREIDKITFGFPFLRKSLERLSKSKVIVMNPEGFKTSDNLGLLLGKYIQATFSATPPPCAQPFLPIGNYQVVFRVIDKPISVSEAVDAEGNTTVQFEY